MKLIYNDYENIVPGQISDYDNKLDRELMVQLINQKTPSSIVGSDKSKIKVRFKDNTLSDDNNDLRS